MAVSRKWNDKDRKYIFDKVARKAIDKLGSKYSDVSFRKEDVEKVIKSEIKALDLLKLD